MGEGVVEWVGEWWVVEWVGEVVGGGVGGSAVNILTLNCSSMTSRFCSRTS